MRMSSTVLVRAAVGSERRNLERSGPIQIETRVGHVKLQLTDDIESLASVWEDLQLRAPCTPPQTYAWARAWVRHMVRPESGQVVIVTGHDGNGRVLFLLPLDKSRKYGMTILSWLGQAHANYNMGLFEPEAAARFTTEDVHALLAAIAAASGADAAVFYSQPYSWEGVSNPFAKLPHQRAASNGFAVTLGDFDKMWHERFSKQSRRNFDRKERKLAEMGLLDYGWAETEAERLALVETLFAQRSRQYAELGVGDIFDEKGRAFYRELALLPNDSPSRLRLGYLKVGDEVAAMFCGSILHNRLSVCFSSMAAGPMQKQSPGALLLRQQIKEACGKDLAFYDIGVGASRHKDEWSDVEQSLFDSFLAFKPQGYLVMLPAALLTRLKGAIKASPRLWPLALRVRQSLFGRKAKQ
jgi:CelD/BcsL family acetyltransferase involved in cellulose biosynthesis